MFDTDALDQQPAARKPIIDPRNGRPTVARSCPSCSRRFAAVVDPQCLICDGSGLLVLGAGAVELHGAEATSLAIEAILEKSARHSLAEAHTPFATSRARLAALMPEMRRVGLLALRPGERAFIGRKNLRRHARTVPAVLEGPGHESVPADQQEWTVTDLPMRQLGSGFECAVWLCHLVVAPADSGADEASEYPSLFDSVAR